MHLNVSGMKIYFTWASVSLSRALADRGVLGVF